MHYVLNFKHHVVLSLILNFIMFYDMQPDTQNLNERKQFS